jgi:hypothetical protein
VVIDADVPMGFRAGQSAHNAVALNPGHPDLLKTFDCHYAGLGDVFVSMVVVTESVDRDRAGELTIIDQRPMPSWAVSAVPSPLHRTLRRYGALTARLPEGYTELATEAMIDEVGEHAEQVLGIAASGGSLLECALAGLPAAAALDPIRARGYLVPVAQLRRASRMDEPA